MAMKLIVWSPEQAKREVSKRYQNAVESRRYWEDRWQRNEQGVYSTTASMNLTSVDTSLEANYQIGVPGIDASTADMNVSYAFKNLRFVHAQMSANPPSVVMRPNSSDPDDRRAADAADRVVRYAIRHYQLQEQADRMSLSTLMYGTGILKMRWDSDLGEILEMDRETGEVTTEGDIHVTVPSLWHVYLDPDARSPEEIKWVIERIFIDYDEACAKWPDKEELLKKSRVAEVPRGDLGRDTQLRSNQYNMVELLEYWETGLPTNGFLGRYTITTIEGDEIEACRPSPHRFSKVGKKAEVMRDDLMTDEEKDEKLNKLPEVATLPYHILTDVDIPNKVMGRSSMDYATNLQSTLNKLDSAIVDNIQAHGAVRLILPESAEISEDSVTNSPWDIIKITGSQPPFAMQPPQLMPDMHQLRTNLVTGINDMFGVNEAMFGQQSREQSGASMQYATNQGNMIRRRLFNKYVLVIESIYKSLLRMIVKHWDTERTIHVIGKEKALEAVDLLGIDIDGGYDVIGEYGVSLSLDPMTRREEILALQPTFEKAGIPPRVTLKMMKLNELEGMYDLLQLAEDRQREYFEEMISTGRFVPPEMYEDHENMMAWALQYFMTVEFKFLEPDLKNLCRQHYQARAQLAAQEKAPAVPGAPTPAGLAPIGGPNPPGPPPSGAPEGPLPVAPGMTGEQTTAAEAPPTPAGNITP